MGYVPMRRFALVLVFAFLLSGALPMAAFAQTPEPTATPELSEYHTLTSGAGYVVERRISYGEIFLVIAILIGVAAFLLRWAYDFAMRWLN